MKSGIKLIRLPLLLYAVCLLISSNPARQVSDPAISLFGVYEYVYEYNTEDLIENHYIELIDSVGKITGYYYGTSDDFDDAREGYLPGYFSAKMKNLIITDSTMSFEIEVKDTKFFTRPITPLIKIENNANWEIGIRYIKRDYEGEIKNGQIIILTENFDPRVFRKINN